ncbi:MAG: preprotein translocase subunit SecG [Neisseriaceae bacterium]
MEIIKTLCWVMQIISAVAIIILVLLQHGKGADAGATFGSGSSSSLFGATGSANFLSRTTAVFAAVFFITTFGLVFMSSKGGFNNVGVMSNMNGKAVSSGIITTKPVTGDKVNNKPLQVESKNQIPG